MSSFLNPTDTNCSEQAAAFKISTQRAKQQLLARFLVQASIQRSSTIQQGGRHACLCLRSQRGRRHLEPPRQAVTMPVKLQPPQPYVAAPAYTTLPNTKGSALLIRIPQLGVTAVVGWAVARLVLPLLCAGGGVLQLCGVQPASWWALWQHVSSCRMY